MTTTIKFEKDRRIQLYLHMEGASKPHDYKIIEVFCTDPSDGITITNGIVEIFLTAKMIQKKELDFSYSEEENERKK